MNRPCPRIAIIIRRAGGRSALWPHHTRGSSLVRDCRQRTQEDGSDGRTRRQLGGGGGAEYVHSRKTGVMEGDERGGKGLLDWKKKSVVKSRETTKAGLVYLNLPSPPHITAVVAAAASAALIDDWRLLCSNAAFSSESQWRRVSGEDGARTWQRCDCRALAPPPTPPIPIPPRTGFDRRGRSETQNQRTCSSVGREPATLMSSYRGKKETFSGESFK